MTYTAPAACLISEQAPRECEKALIRAFSERTEVFRVPEDPLIPGPVRSHPDMIFSVIGSALAAPAEYCERYPALISGISSRTGKRIVPVYSERGDVYPLDTGLNTASGDGFIILRKKSCPEAVMDLAERNGLLIIDVNQGYAGCSCIVTDRLVITSDPGIKKALLKAGIRAELIDNEGILLPGYDRGFIGGAGGYAAGRLFLFGSPDTFPGGERLRDICENEGIILTELPCPAPRGQVTDFGGIKFIF